MILKEIIVEYFEVKSDILLGWLKINTESPGVVSGNTVKNELGTYRIQVFVFGITNHSHHNAFPIMVSRYLNWYWGRNVGTTGDLIVLPKTSTNSNGSLAACQFVSTRVCIPRFRLYYISRLMRFKVRLSIMPSLQVSCFGHLWQLQISTVRHASFISHI